MIIKPSFIQPVKPENGTKDWQTPYANANMTHAQIRGVANVRNQPLTIGNGLTLTKRDA